MKIKPILFLSIVMLLSAGCEASHTRIAVSGSPGLAFTGTCTGTDATGKPFSQDLAGVVPKEFSIEGHHLDFNAQKNRDEGNLTVTVYKGNSPKASAVNGIQGVQHGVRGKVRWWGLSLKSY
jgi:hypothetical protein